MKHEDIVRIARENGIDWFRIPGVDQVLIEKFANAIAEAEREACAKVCEDIPLPQDAPALTHLPTIERCAAAIRARGET